MTYTLASSSIGPAAPLLVRMSRNAANFSDYLRLVLYVNSWVRWAVMAKGYRLMKQQNLHPFCVCMCLLLKYNFHQSRESITDTRSVRRKSLFLVFGLFCLPAREVEILAIKSDVHAYISYHPFYHSLRTLRIGRETLLRNCVAINVFCRKPDILVRYWK